MSVILIATQVTGEHSKGYIKGTYGGQFHGGRLGAKVWVKTHSGDTLRRALAKILGRIHAYRGQMSIWQTNTRPLGNVGATGSKVSLTFENWSEILLRTTGAGDEDRTRNFQLGKLKLDECLYR
jgi:hypothetical protein